MPLRNGNIFMRADGAAAAGVIAAAPPVAVAQAIVDIGATVANTIAGISDMKKRRDIETALQRLDYADQKALNEKLARAKTQSERLALLVAEVNKSNIAQVTAKGKQDMVIAVVLISSSLIFLLSIIYLRKK